MKGFPKLKTSTLIDLTHFLYKRLYREWVKEGNCTDI